MIVRNLILLLGLLLLPAANSLRLGANGNEMNPMDFFSFMTPPSISGKQADPEALQSFLKAGAGDLAATIQKVSQNEASQGILSGLNKLFRDVVPQAAELQDKATKAAPELMKELKPDSPQSFQQDLQQHAKEAMKHEGTQLLARTFEEGMVGAAGNATQELAQDVKKVDLESWIAAARSARYMEKKDPTAEGEVVSTKKYEEAFRNDANIPLELKEKERLKEEMKKFVHLYRKNPLVTLDTSIGTMELELLLEEVPITASNFLDLCATGFYDGSHFHRVIESFMIQAGDPLSRDLSSEKIGSGHPEPGSLFEILSGPKKGKKVRRSKKDGGIPDEFERKIANEKFTVAMANTGAPNSGGSQFFVNIADNHHLNWFNKRTESNHPVFANVVAGQQVAQEISKVKVGKSDMPLEPVMLVKCALKPEEATKASPGEGTSERGEEDRSA